MALQGKWAILYYGLLASITGGWLPLRAKNWKLTLFHLVFFVAFLCLPLSVFYVSSQRPGEGILVSVFYASSQWQGSGLWHSGVHLQ